MGTFDVNTFLSQIEYYRNTIADSGRKEVDHDQLLVQNRTTLAEMAKGKLSEELTKTLFMQKNGHSEEKWLKACLHHHRVNVVLCPIVMHRENIHQEERSSVPEYVVPLNIPAQLRTDGTLIVNEMVSAAKPWISRCFLEPTGLSSCVIGSVSKLNEFLSRSPVPIKEMVWEVLWDYTLNMFHTVTGHALETFVMPHHAMEAHGYVVLDDRVNGAMHITRLADHLKTNTPSSIGALAQHFFSAEVPAKTPVADAETIFSRSALHVGQMGNEYPLSYSQWEALTHYTHDTTPVFAVNGPSGTGKTTLLLSVIAQEYVQRALKKEQPPVIVASSNNNQAVTNIIDSFSKVFHSDDLLAKRWIEGAESFGSYMVSEGRLKKSKALSDKYLCITAGNQVIDGGFFKALETKTVNQQNIDRFLENASSYFGEKQTKVIQAVGKLHECLTDRVSEIAAVMKKSERLHKEIMTIESRYAPKGVVQSIRELSERHGRAEKQLHSYQQIRNAFYEWIDELPLLRKLTCRLPIIENLYVGAVQSFTDQHPGLFAVDETYTVRTATERLNAKIGEQNNFVSALASDLNVFKADRAKMESFQKDLVALANHYDQKQEQTYKANMHHVINDLLDQTLRYEAFRLAAHYYEGRYLMEVRALLREDKKDGKTSYKRRKQLERLAKVTPCFVSTFYMVPKFFYTYDYGKSNYYYEGIDLLIVDEAGQASPEVCMPLMPLAKRALIVGDILQIEPVWSVTEMTDAENVGVYMPELPYDEWAERGYVGASGNLMKIAKEKSAFTKFEEGGLYLTEHRRCIPEIIEYCNDLAYQGKLEPKRKNVLEAYPFPHMGHIHAGGKCARHGGSRVNRQEARAIVHWIVDHASDMQTFYEDKKTNTIKPIHEIIAVVTPFSAQASIIKKELAVYPEYQEITVGTVHALQGAERNIILFSTVYDHTHSGSFFFDRGKNMLNVAVSRAKDAFIVIGDQGVLGKGSGESPSGLLAEYLDFEQSTASETVV